MSGLRDLPTLSEMNAAPRACPKGSSRLQDTQADDKRILIDDKAFRAAVWTRDERRCRKCGREVKKQLRRAPERGEVHHLHRRTGFLRFEAKAAILLCLECHEKVTGRVNERWVIEPATKGVWWFCVDSSDERFIDARKPLRFVRAA